ncbi:MAG: ribosome silencing factor [Leptolyngbya sp. SIO1D8]|nr:ribosome silencing factor [Leptolyngbya sp. SIO1D8]
MSDFPNPVIPTRTTQPETPVTQPSEESALTLATTIAQAADDRKGANIRVLKVTEVSYLADYFVVVTGFSAVQVRAIARSIEDTVAETLHCEPLRTEGQLEGTWILQDYGDVIAHIFMPDEREFYGLEAFWGHAEEVSWDIESKE